MLRTAATGVTLMMLGDVCQGLEQEQSHGLYKLNLKTLASFYGKILKNPSLLSTVAGVESVSASESLINLLDSAHPRVQHLESCSNWFFPFVCGVDTANCQVLTPACFICESVPYCDDVVEDEDDV